MRLIAYALPASTMIYENRVQAYSPEKSGDYCCDEFHKLEGKGENHDC